jgi:hypothetical protein
MEKLYRITPLEKKNIEYFVDVFERMPDNTIRGFDVTEIWRWGQGFRELDEPVMSYEIDLERAHGVHCRPNLGWGCELDDLIAVYVNFSDGYTEEEKVKIESILRGEDEDEEGRWGTAWLYDGDHNIEIEDDHVRIIGPVKIDLCDTDGTIIEEDIKVQEDQEVQATATNWPFTQQEEQK